MQVKKILSLINLRALMFKDSTIRNEAKVMVPAVIDTENLYFCDWSHHVPHLSHISEDSY